MRSDLMSTDGPERTSAGAVRISKPGLPVALLVRRPELAGIGIGTYLLEGVIG